MDTQTIISVLSSSIRVTTPILFVALAACFSEQAGVFAMGLEGFMLMGAFSAVVGSLLTGSQLLGFLIGVLAGVLMALIFGFATINLGAEQVLSGLAINMFALGSTGFLMRLVWGVEGIPITPAMNTIPIPVLSSIPILGPVLFNQQILTYLAYITVPFAYWLLYKSRWGLELRAVGEKPQAADTVGIGVNATRYFAVLLSGALAGIGGSVLSLQQVNTFTQGMSGGRGWLGLIAAIFGQWNPLGAAGASLVFGFANAMQLRIQLSPIKISSWLVLMIPHVIAIILIAIVGKAARHPAAIGIKYTKE